MRHQYPPPETRPTLHNPLGLSQGLKSSLTSPQLGRKAAAIALPFWAKSDVMLQSPPRRKWYIFYEVRYVRYRQPSEPKKCVSIHRSHTPNLPRSSTVQYNTIQLSHSPFFQLNCNLRGQPAVRDISTHRPNFAPPPPSPAQVY